MHNICTVYVSLSTKALSTQINLARGTTLLIETTSQQKLVF